MFYTDGKTLIDWEKTTILVFAIVIALMIISVSGLCFYIKKKLSTISQNQTQKNIYGHKERLQTNIKKFDIGGIDFWVILGVEAISIMSLMLWLILNVDQEKPIRSFELLLILISLVSGLALLGSNFKNKDVTKWRK